MGGANGMALFVPTIHIKLFSKSCSSCPSHIHNIPEPFEADEADEERCKHTKMLPLVMFSLRKVIYAVQERAWQSQGRVWLEAGYPHKIPIRWPCWWRNWHKLTIDHQICGHPMFGQTICGWWSEKKNKSNRELAVMGLFWWEFHGISDLLCPVPPKKASDEMSTGLVKLQFINSGCPHSSDGMEYYNE